MPKGKYKKNIILLTAAFFVVVFPIAALAKLNTPTDKFVRSANYYLKAGIGIPSADYPQLAKYDLLILPAEAQVYNRRMFVELRRLNPEITILAYVPTKSFNFQYWFDPLHQTLQQRIQNDWWLQDESGQQISIWPGTKMLNMVSGWGKELPKYVNEEIWSTGVWDGIMYDEFSATASWINGGDIDIHRDRQRDNPQLVDAAWERATINMLRETRLLLGSEAVIITNGDSAASVQPFVNGRIFESFPTPWEGQGRWQDSIGSYLRLQQQVGYQPVFIINGSTGNTGNYFDYRRVRFALTSALLGDGFFSYDYGEQDHGQLLWYDEQNVNLGQPLGPAANLTLPQARDTRPGVWRRDFNHGVVLTNSTDRSQTINFDAELEHVLGTQDPNLNNGLIATSITLPPYDGVLLLKPIENIVGSAFLNGAFTRIYDRTGNKIRNGFFSYVPPFSGSSRIIIRDLNGDQQLEKIVAGPTEVSIFNSSNNLLVSFAPYGQDFHQGVNIAVGDLNGDGNYKIITGPKSNMKPLVLIFDLNGKKLNDGFYAYDYRFQGGVYVAAGDLYGAGRDMIITGAGPGGGPHVRVFDRYGYIWAQFFAYDWRFRGGVEVCAGDLDHDGRDEIVTGAGPGGGPHVRIFNGWSRVLGGFFVGNQNNRNGIHVAITDSNDDGHDEIAAMTTDIFQISTQ
jgi:hypothetical protein